jgi:hypothetical protein
MIEVASRATNGVNIPNRKCTREEILDMFKNQMSRLKEQLNVCQVLLLTLSHYLQVNLIQSPAVTGEISLTCDAWQASNTDGYFSVTGHWIEEPQPGVWEVQSALLGFTRLNNSHNGKHLGGALFKIVDRLGISDRVKWYAPTIAISLSYTASQIGHITADNASNNDTMMEFFAKYIEKRTNTSFPYEDRRIR